MTTKRGKRIRIRNIAFFFSVLFIVINISLGWFFALKTQNEGVATTVLQLACGTGGVFEVMTAVIGICEVLSGRKKSNDNQQQDL